jgi:hypothetical protein
MLRKALQGAAVTGAAVALSFGASSPAMAGGSEHEYDYSAHDFGGVNILSNFCLDINDVLDLVDVDVLTMTGGNNCDFINSEVHSTGNEIEIDD